MTDLSSRYNLSASPDWQALLTHFELGQGFAFLVLLVPNQDGADVCRAALSQYLSERGQQLREIPVLSPVDLRNIAEPLLDLHADSGTGAIWVARAVPEAVPEFPVWQDAWREGVARLNQFRNPLRRQFDIPLIFVGASWLQVVLREAAPDLWSVRTLVAWVEPQATEGLLETPRFSRDPVGLSRSPDPELALREANRLRGKDGAELAIARLLYRAGLGFAARYQWAEAAKAISESLEIRRQSGAPIEEIAQTGHRLGQVLSFLADYDRATAVLTQAQAEFEMLSNARGAAACTWELGNIALRRDDNEGARRSFEEALATYRSTGDQSAEAHCLRGIGLVALWKLDLDAANAYYEEALTLCRRIGDVSGEATSLLRLGDIASRRSDYLTAKALSEEAMVLYIRMGNPFGRANSMFRLGEVALRQSDTETARRRYEEALLLFRSVGEVLGEANCAAGFGEIAVVQGDIGTAKQHLQAAIKLYVQIGELYSVGRMFVLLGSISSGDERAAYLEKASSAFQTIGRQDLIENLEKEFPTFPKPPAAAPK